MQRVEDKVSRSKRLLFNLESEKHRWEDSSKNFKEQLATMLGDVFLSSAFLSYIGFFDHFYRKMLVGAWKSSLETSEIKFRHDISLIEYLSTASERLIWKSHKLPSDDLCTENAIILKRFNRYPLIIDPSSQALEFITSMLSSKKYNLSSFVDVSFMKNLETSLRFGFPLIVQDVEKVDPILNSVLNKEIYKTGGRVLIRVGDQ
jgi:dynein heavy chain 1